jgi:hypothetical protein
MKHSVYDKTSGDYIGPDFDLIEEYGDMHGPCDFNESWVWRQLQEGWKEPECPPTTTFHGRDYKSDCEKVHKLIVELKAAIKRRTEIKAELQENTWQIATGLWEICSRLRPYGLRDKFLNMIFVAKNANRWMALSEGRKISKYEKLTKDRRWADIDSRLEYGKKLPHGVHPAPVQEPAPVQQPPSLAPTQTVAGDLTREQIIAAMNPERCITASSLHEKYGFERSQWDRFTREMVEKGFAERVDEDSIRVRRKQEGATAAG